MRFSIKSTGIVLLAIWAGGCQAPPPQAPELRVMSFNIRYDNPGDGPDAWPLRKELVTGLIDYHRPDVLGLQEALRHQIDDLQQALPDFAWYGIGRSDGRNAGEFAPIFYNRHRFIAAQHGTFWLSETPTDTGSVGWDAALERIATWMILRDYASGRRFFVLNTHFDHQGAAARLNSARLIKQQLAVLATDLPIVVLGDFNCEPGSAPYQTLTDSTSPRLHDARFIAARGHYGPEGTFTGFRHEANPPPRIDFIFTGENVAVRRHAVLSDHLDGRLPSDHRPVVASIALQH